MLIFLKEIESQHEKNIYMYIYFVFVICIMNNYWQRNYSLILILGVLVCVCVCMYVSVWVAFSVCLLSVYLRVVNMARLRNETIFTLQQLRALHNRESS